MLRIICRLYRLGVHEWLERHGCGPGKRQCQGKGAWAGLGSAVWQRAALG